MSRRDGREPRQIRKVVIKKNYIKHAHGSCLIAFGDTHVVCTAMIEDGVPPFLKGTGQGWVTAEYGMLPGSCPQRVKRNQTAGRIQEIQRLIGRSLRSVVEMSELGERTVKIDCDVIQADGGTRTASVTGGCVALALALKKAKTDGLIPSVPVKDLVAAVSVGVCDGEVAVDLNYAEDSTAGVDMNVVMTGHGKIVEIQGTAEGAPFSKKQFDQMYAAAADGIGAIVAVQRAALKGCGIGED